jgi:cytosine deaminase
MESVPLKQPESSGDLARYPDDVYAEKVISLAQRAAEKGTYGIGAILLDENNVIVAQGYNEVHLNGFRSDLHAEMVVLNKWEETHPSATDTGKLTLISSLEPCPMCMTRIIFSGVGCIKFICPDPLGGMVRRLETMPPIFRQLSTEQRQSWRQADCSPRYQQLAFEAWDKTRADLDKKVMTRSRGEKDGTEE